MEALRREAALFGKLDTSMELLVFILETGKVLAGKY